MHSAGKQFGPFVSAIGEAHPDSISSDASRKRRAAQAIKMALMAKVLGSSKLHVDALRLKNYADLTAQGVSILGDVVSEDQARPAVGTIRVERIRNSVVLPLPLRAEQAKQLRRLNIERHAIERGALIVAVN